MTTWDNQRRSREFDRLGVEGIQVNRSSGHREIDRAAIEFVRLASPYAPLPDNIRERVDVLHITRTWRFESAFGVD